jgi:hypothetical protein
MRFLKTSIAALTMMLLLSFNAFSQQANKEITRMLEDKQKREALFSVILNNDQLKEELMKRMMADKEGSGMMMNHMMHQAKNDSTMCKKMCSMMMDSDKMMNMMDDMKNNSSPKDTGNKEGNSHMQHHMDDKHKGKKKH